MAQEEKQKKYGYIETVSADLFRYRRKKSFKAFIQNYIFCPEFRYIFWFRTTYALRLHPILRIFHYASRYILYHLKIKLGINISYNTSIQPGFY